MYSFLFFHVTGDIATTFTLELFVKMKSNLTRFYKTHYSMQTRIFVKKKNNLTRFYETHSMQTTHVGAWAVLYFYGEPRVPVLKNINWNGSSSGSTHKWNRKSRFWVQIFPKKKYRILWNTLEHSILMWNLQNKIKLLTLTLT